MGEAIPRKDVPTFRGTTGYLGAKFTEEKIGMDYAFLSTSYDEDVANDFAAKAATCVVFEIEYTPTTPGVDISMVSVHPEEKEVLFPPCIGLNLVREKDESNMRKVVVRPSVKA